MISNSKSMNTAGIVRQIFVAEIIYRVLPSLQMPLESVGPSMKTFSDIIHRDTKDPQEKYIRTQ